MSTSRGFCLSPLAYLEYVHSSPSAMEAPNPSVKAADVEPKQSNTQMSILPAVQPANVVGNTEEEEDELAEDDDVVMADVAAGSSAVPSQSRPQSTPVSLPRSAPRADEETTTAAPAPASVPNPTQTTPATSAPAKKPHKPRAPKPEKSMMTSFKVRPPKEGAVNPVMSTTAPSASSGQVQLNVPAPVPTTEAGASKSSKSTPVPKAQMKKRSRCVASRFYQISMSSFLISTLLDARNPTTRTFKCFTTTMQQLPQRWPQRTNTPLKQRPHLCLLRPHRPGPHRSNAAHNRNNQQSPSQFPSRIHWTSVENPQKRGVHRTGPSKQSPARRSARVYGRATV